MATKKFSSQILIQNQDNTIMTGNNDSTVVVNFCNQTAVPVNIWLAYTDQNGQYNRGDYILYQFPVAPYTSYPVKGIAIESMHSLIAKSDANNVSVVVYGVEEDY